MCISYNLECDLDLMGNLMNWFVWVGYVSSGVNPCVYTLFSRQFRETFKEIICLRCSEIPHHNRRRQFRTHNFDCGTAGSSTSSFHRDYSYKRYETSRDIGSLENGSRFGRSQSEHDEFESCQPRGADEAADPENISKYENNAQEKHSMDSQWRSTWHSTNRGDTLNELKLTESIRIHSVSRVTFREAFLQPYSKRKPLLQKSEDLSNQDIKDMKARNSETLWPDVSERRVGDKDDDVRAEQIVIKYSSSSRDAWRKHTNKWLPCTNADPKNHVLKGSSTKVLHVHYRYRLSVKNISFII